MHLADLPPFFPTAGMRCSSYLRTVLASDNTASVGRYFNRNTFVEVRFMAMRITPNLAATSAKMAGTMEGAYRTLAASSRQKTFERVLNQAQATGEDSRSSETNSLQAEMSKLQAFPAAGASACAPESDPRQVLSATAGQMADSNVLATSALLKLSAMSYRGGGLGKYCLNAMGPAASAESRYLPDKDTRRSGTRSVSYLSDEIGSLSSRFESGAAGVDVIGYDRNGGTSYGIYQISSRAGTMKNFINYLEDESPEWARRLQAAGPANTGGIRGRMPAEWKRIAAEDPERFAQLQHDFIAETHFGPAAQEIQERTGVDVTKESRALKEVLWSTAVQHGPNGAARIFCKAINHGRNKKEAATQPSDIIDNVYSSRARQFGSSSSAVQNAVRGRFREEKALALAMLTEDTPYRTLGA